MGTWEEEHSLGLFFERWEDVASGCCMNLLLTVGYLHVLGVPQGGGDHEHQGEHQLQAEQRHQPRHREGRHHRVGLLQVTAHWSSPILILSMYIDIQNI